MPDISTLRKCPACGSKNYRRGLVYTHYIEHRDGKTTRWQAGAGDAGLFRCLDCGEEVHF